MKDGCPIILHRKESMKSQIDSFSNTLCKLRRLYKPKPPHRFYTSESLSLSYDIPFKPFINTSKTLIELNQELSFYLGVYYSEESKIVLYSDSIKVFCHELNHAADNFLGYWDLEQYMENKEYFLRSEICADIGSFLLLNHLNKIELYHLNDTIFYILDLYIKIHKSKNSLFKNMFFNRKHSPIIFKNRNLIDKEILKLDSKIYLTDYGINIIPHIINIIREEEERISNCVHMIINS